MTYRLSVGISAGIHLAILMVLVIVSFAGRPDEFVSESIRIRIKMHGQSGGNRIVSAGEPSGMNRLQRPVSELPAAVSPARATDAPGEVQRHIPSAEVERTFETTAPSDELRAVDPFLDGVAAPDPMAGIELPDMSTEAAATGSDNLWKVSWSDGEDRAILRYPQLDEAALPETTERLSGLVIAIVVSPAGEVISAEVKGPGSGDLRIDRLLVGLAQDLLLEPVFAEEGDMEGEIHLVLVEGSE